MSEDPERVIRSILSVQQALQRWQAAAQAAVEAGRDEYQSTSALVERSGRAAMAARVGAENLAGELARLGSALEGARGGLMAAAAAVEARARKHAELVDHVRQTSEAWNGHVRRAQRDYQAAQGHRAQAAQVLLLADGELEAARALVQRAPSDAEQAGAMARLRRAEAEYGLAHRSHEQAVWQEQQQQARVARYRQALGLAEQASTELEGAEKDVTAATTAVATAQAQLANVEAGMKTAHAHLRRMQQGADEAVSHANRADQDLITAGQHLSEVEDWHQRGQLLTLDASYEMTDIIQQLRHIDVPMGGGGGGVESDGELPAERASGDVAALRDLAAFREREGMPVAGSPEDEDTAARLDVPGSGPLYGRNAHGAAITMRVNAQTATHAEAAVFQQALDKGLEGDRVTMYVDRPLCRACGKSGGIGSMLRATGFTAVEVVAPDGRFLISADRPSRPVRIGDAP